MIQDALFSVPLLPWLEKGLDCLLTLCAPSMILSLPWTHGQHDKQSHYISSSVFTLALRYYG